MDSSRGILILSVGKPLYGRLAAVLAASIKNQSEIPIHLIHDSDSLKDLKAQRNLFDSEVLIHTDKSISDSENAFKAKTELYRLSPFQKTIFLDADAIMLPGKKVDSWFDELDGIPFTACVNGFYDYASGEHSRADYPYWGDVTAVKEHFNIADDAKLPQLNSSFLYFEKGDKAEELFRIAKTVWSDPFQSGTYRNAKTDEFCFNVACALTQTYPHQFPYRPIYFFFQTENLSEVYIQDNFNALAVITDSVDERVIDLYNKYMDYYFRKFGFKERFFFSNKDEKEPRPVKGFWHIATMNDWKEVVREQLMILKHDGLYEMCEQIYVSVGTDNPGSTLKQIADIGSEFQNLFQNFPKIYIVKVSPLSEFEFPALTVMKAQASKSKFFGFYFHTKGVSIASTDPMYKYKSNWRDLLNHYVLRCWRKLYNKILLSYDIAGVNWKDENFDHPAHYSGNFYWFDSEYIKRLPEVYTLNKRDRYQAEMWVTKAIPKHFDCAFHWCSDTESDWFPKRKIGIFWQVGDDYSAKIGLLRNSGLLQEAHQSVAFTGTGYDLAGFDFVSVGGFEEHLRSYCLLNSDALICLATENDGLFSWKRCYDILHQGYDSVACGEKIVWVTASFINSLDTLDDTPHL